MLKTHSVQIRDEDYLLLKEVVAAYSIRPTLQAVVSAAIRELHAREMAKIREARA